MNNKDKVLITGATGMVGQAVVRQLADKCEYIGIGSKDCNLLRYEEVDAFIQQHKPTKIIHLAAKVGGVKANTDYVADFFNENILINTNVLMAAHKNGVNDIVSLLSTCVYPDKDWVEYPLSEEQLHIGPPHDSNFGYAYAKRMLEVQSRAYRQQHNRNYKCAIPNNIFGFGDNFHLESGHVAPAVIRKIYEAKMSDTVPTFWGDGSSLREFTFADDIAACLVKMTFDTNNSNILCNIGTDEEVSIKDLVMMVCEIYDYNGPIVWDETKPAGQHRKPSKKQYIQHTYKPLYEGLKETCEWFKVNYSNAKGII